MHYYAHYKNSIEELNPSEAPDREERELNCEHSEIKSQISAFSGEGVWLLLHYRNKTKPGGSFVAGFKDWGFLSTLAEMGGKKDYFLTSFVLLEHHLEN